MTVTRREMLAAAALAAVSNTRLLAAGPGRIVMIDPALPLEGRRIAAGYDLTGRVMVKADFVRQWRDGLETQIIAAGGALALVRWDKALLLLGLARESGLRARQERLGRATILITIDRSNIAWAAPSEQRPA